MKTAGSPRRRTINRSIGFDSLQVVVRGLSLIPGEGGRLILDDFHMTHGRSWSGVPFG